MAPHKHKKDSKRESGRQQPSRQNSNRHDQASSSGWTNWEWFDAHKQEVRWQTDRDGKPINYEYRNPPSQNQDFGSTSSQTLSMELGSSPPQGTYNYTLDPVLEGVTAQFDNTNLDSENNAEVTPSKFIKTKDESKQTEDFPFGESYRVQKQSHFKIGKVFKVLWSEPKGNNLNQGNAHTAHTVTEYTKRQGNEGEQYAKTRRFVVVKVWEGHCTCLAINTYGHQGTTKRGVHAEDHTVIHTTPNAIFLPGEMLKKAPIRMQPKHPRHQLNKESRLNYAKIYTVECNVKVWFIGDIHKDSMHQLVTSYNDTHGLLKYPGSSSSQSIAETPIEQATRGTGTGFNDPTSSAGYGNLTSVSKWSQPVSSTGGYNYQPSLISSGVTRPYTYSPNTQANDPRYGSLAQSSVSSNYATGGHSSTVSPNYTSYPVVNTGEGQSQYSHTGYTHPPQAPHTPQPLERTSSSDANQYGQPRDDEFPPDDHGNLYDDE